jgi:aerobic C4-dicarboxylate transport protein
VRRFSRSLYLQVITAVVIGAVVGHVYPKFGVELKPLGEGFIKLVKMLIAPIVFSTVVTGIAKMGDLKSAELEPVTAVALTPSGFPAQQA